MAQQITYSNYLGEFDFWAPSRDFYTALLDSTGNYETGLTLSASNGVNLRIVGPDGTIRLFDGTTGTANIFTETAISGVYRVRLFGSGTGVTLDQIGLNQVGKYGLYIQPVGSADFEELNAWYEVLPNLSVQFALTDLPYTGGSRQGKGVIALYKWKTQELVATGDTALTGLDVTIEDRNGTNLYSFDKNDAVASGGFFWYSQISSGGLGGDALVAKVVVTYKGYTHTHTQPLISRRGA